MREGMNEQMGMQGSEAPSGRPRPPTSAGQAHGEHRHFPVIRGTGRWERVGRGSDLGVRELRREVI